jgi:PAS domain S-box-containing protein
MSGVRGFELRDASLEDFFENGAVGLHIVRYDGVILRANRAELQLLGYKPDEYVGRQIADFHADPETISDILARLGRGEVLNKYPARLRAKDGSIRHVQISSSVCFDENGEFRNTRCFTVDVTDKYRAEQELLEAQQRLIATYDRALAGISEVDALGRLLRTNDGLAHLVGRPKSELVGRSVFSFTHPDDLEEDRQQFQRQVRGEISQYDTEKRYVRADGSTLWVHLLSSTVKDMNGSFLYAVRVATDVDERKRAEARYQVLINELNHRVKNTLATVQSFAKQTASRSADISDFMSRFEGRLMALSKAHDRLTRRSWQGTSLSEIVSEELALHGGEQRGLSLSGEDVALSPRHALALSMALHELGTNAIKYGALSRPQGSIRVEWAVERDNHSTPKRVRLAWSETGGPAPSRDRGSGFGSRLLDAMAVEMEGEAEREFAPEGLIWRVSFPVKPTET